MQNDQKQLHQIAQNCPYYLFTVEQIAVLCNVSRDVVTKARLADDSPFFLNKCRPEWFTEWMRQHPEFQLTKGEADGYNSKESDGAEPCPRCGTSRTLNRLRKKKSQRVPPVVQRR
jgi:hypothetical protein